MPRCILSFKIFLSVAIFTTGAFGQTSISINNGPEGLSGTAHFGAPNAAPAPVTGEPYSGEEISEQVDTLADGTHISRKFPPTRVYRDSAGRTRTERALAGGETLTGKIPDSPLLIEITDPVAHVRYTLDTVNKIAHRQLLPANSAVQSGPTQPSNQGVAAKAPSADATGPQFTTTNLGAKTIDGIPVEGIRRTTTWPVNSQGNDRPISVVNETWTSPELKVLIRSKLTDPRNGEHSQTLSNISRSEPPASLFQPPPGYTVVNDSGPFTIQWGSK